MTQPKIVNTFFIIPSMLNLIALGSRKVYLWYSELLTCVDQATLNEPACDNPS